MKMREVLVVTDAEDNVIKTVNVTGVPSTDIEELEETILRNMPLNSKVYFEVVGKNS